MRFSLTGGIVAGGLGLLLVAGGTVAARQATTLQNKVQEDEFLKGVFATDTPGLKLPAVTKFVHPRYTADAMRAKLQGKVEVQAVVLPDGTVGRARIIASLDKVFGLDAEAVKAARQFLFTPGVLNGRDVPVAVTLTLEFRLH